MVPRSASTTSSAWRLAHWPPARNVTDPRSARWPELPGLGVQPVRYSEQRRLLAANVLPPERIAGYDAWPRRVLGPGLWAGRCRGARSFGRVPHPLQGGVGTLRWPSAFGGWWQTDPTGGSVLPFLAHIAFDIDRVAQGLAFVVYDAIAHSHVAEAAAHGRCGSTSDL
jgi:hypothetical protein